jgi:hypothetical protein
LIFLPSFVVDVVGAKETSEEDVDVIVYEIKKIKKS